MNVELVEGKPARIVCTIIGVPKPEVSWWKDGQPIQPGDGLYFENKDGGDVYELVIEDTVPEDAGIYQVKAFNEGGIAEAEATLGILVPATFAVPLKTEAEFIVGKKIKLTCQIFGIPKPRLVWYHDNFDISNNFRYKRKFDEDGNYQMTIASANIMDRGVYRAEAINSVGRDVCECKVKVWETNGNLLQS